VIIGAGFVVGRIGKKHEKRGGVNGEALSKIKKSNGCFVFNYRDNAIITVIFNFSYCDQS